VRGDSTQFKSRFLCAEITTATSIQQQFNLLRLNRLLHLRTVNILPHNIHHLIPESARDRRARERNTRREKNKNRRLQALQAWQIWLRHNTREPPLSLQQTIFYITRIKMM
jgi:hypothetical protein